MNKLKVPRQKTVTWYKEPGSLIRKGGKDSVWKGKRRSIMGGLKVPCTYDP